MVTYDEYPTNMVSEIKFEGDYGLVQIAGLDYNSYFTVIDKDGKQLFEPILYHNSYHVGKRVLREGLLVYYTKVVSEGSTENRAAVVDVNGNTVIPENAGYCYISNFSGGYAFAQKGETGDMVVIDAKGNIVADTFTIKQ